MTYFTASDADVRFLAHPDPAMTGRIDAAYFSVAYGASPMPFRNYRRRHFDDVARGHEIAELQLVLNEADFETTWRSFPVSFYVGDVEVKYVGAGPEGAVRTGLVLVRGYVSQVGRRVAVGAQTLPTVTLRFEQAVPLGQERLRTNASGSVAGDPPMGNPVQIAYPVYAQGDVGPERLYNPALAGTYTTTSRIGPGIMGVGGVEEGDLTHALPRRWAGAPVLELRRQGQAVVGVWSVEAGRYVGVWSGPSPAPVRTLGTILAEAERLLLPPDTTPPTCVISSDAPALVNAPFQVTVTFSEDVTGFAVADVTVSNGSASSFSGSGSVYTCTITPSTDGVVQVSVAAGTYADTAGNAGEASNTLSRTYDGTAPTVVVSGPVAAGMEYDVGIEFSEDVAGLVLAGIAVGNGTASNLQGSGASYTATITRTLEDDATVQVQAGACADAAGNANTASNVLATAFTPGPPLDAYEDDVVAAYSMRRLLTSWAGPAIRVRRSSDNAETDVGFDANGLLDAAAVLAFAGEGSAFIVTRYNQAGGPHVTQAMAARQPRIVNAGVLETLSSGHAAGRWDLTDDRLVSGSSITLPQPFVAISVIEAAATGVNGRAWAAGSVDLAIRTNDYQLNAGNNLRRGTPDGLLHVITGVVNSPSSAIRRDGVQLGLVGDAGANAGTGTFIEGNNSGGAVPLGGLLTETIVFSTVPAQLAVIEAEIVSYYS